MGYLGHPNVKKLLKANSAYDILDT